MEGKYKTIIKPSEGLYKDKGSKFISYALPVTNLDEIKAYLEKYHKQHFDARHLCYAYMLGEERNDFRANDDGEPSSTAGKPILGQINSYELTNILIIVIRYFGGILLGTSGLITAYKTAAEDAIMNNEIIEKTITRTLSIHFEYPLMSDVSRIIKEFDLTIVNQQFEYDCILTFAIPINVFDIIKVRFQKIYGIEILDQPEIL